MIRTERWTQVVCVLMMGLLVVGSAGCKKKKPPINPNLGAPTTGTGTSTTGALPDINNLPWQKATDLQTVYFDYDSHVLRDDARNALKANADIMKSNANAYFRVEGHCDERGTQEYNIALGERRALATREYLMSLGVSGDRIITVSYGEEMPAAMGSGESAWSQNRRCEFSRAFAGGM